ncbi:ribosomal-processing cysteine protease Prp [Ligilactobacillus agilis]|uniref:ribosomal-processing cysteine protease Prp n=1 Tax=Ligilactobacillus agilis TaxID=1601 RepID=UPI00255CB0F5|nr:ribosomal-processing cysteine protease Prp [Ligilactobacillus agilis]
MIHAKFTKKGDLITAFEMYGHAGYADSGFDIVCAAVSVLAINTVNSLEQLVKIKPLVVEDSTEGGFLRLEVGAKDLDKPGVQILLAALELGISDLVKQAEYQKYISLD